MVMNIVEGVSIFKFETLCKVKLYNGMCNLDKLEMIKTVLNF